VREHPLKQPSDLLAWFSEDERVECANCSERACVRGPDASACVCMACGAVSVHGVRIDIA